LPWLTVGRVLMLTTLNVTPTPSKMNISFPSDDQAAHEPSVIWYVSPVLGNGCRKIRDNPEPSRVEYAIHRPSREKLPSGMPDETTPPKAVAFLLFSEYVHNENLLSFCTLKTNVSRSKGDHEFGMWASPDSALVRRSAIPLPSARCHQIPRSPSRSD